MASLDLGTLVAHIKVEGANAAQNTLRGVSNAMGQTGTSATGATAGMSSFMSSITSGLGNVSLFGTNLGTLGTALGGSEAASVALGTALGGACVAGIMAAANAVKELAKACADFVKDSVQVGISFQAQMSKVQAISGESEQGLNTLTEAARQFGKDTVFSATEVAQAFEYTALAGYSTQESISAMPGILNLAAASGMSLAKASDIVTDDLTAFGMSVDESTHLADVMAYAMSHTNTNTEQLGEAYKNCAATCHAFGVSAEESTAWLGQLANAGIKGGEAGTALNAVLARMYGESKTTQKALEQYGLSMYDANGKAKNFTVVIGEMQQAMKGMNDEQKNVFMKAVAGVNHLSDFATIMNVAADNTKELTYELENCDGASSKMVKTMTDNIAGLQKSIDSKIESIKISIFTAIEPIITDVMKLFESFVNAVSTILQPIGNIIGAVLDLFTPLIDGITSIINQIVATSNTLLKPVGDLIVATIKVIGSVLGGLINVIVNVISTTITILSPISAVLGKIAEMIMAVGQAIADSIMPYLEPVITEVKGFLDYVNEKIMYLPNTIIKGINAVIDAINLLCGSSIEKIEYLSDGYDKSMDDMGGSTEEFTEQAESLMADYGTTIEDITAAGYTSFEEMYNSIQQLDDETYGQLKENADSYNNEYQLKMDALAEFEKDKTKEMMDSWEKANKDKAGSMEYYLEKAEHQAAVEEALANKTADTKADINKEYTGKLEKELNKQQKIAQQRTTDNSKEYDKDYNAFAKNEEKKTKKFEEESRKRQEKTSSSSNSFGIAAGIVQGIRGAFASGTNYVPATGNYLVGEHGPEIVTLPQAAKVIPNHAIGGNTTNNYSVSINASNVREFNDIISICKNARMTERGCN